METSVIINFKAYERSTGDNALELARICDGVAKETGARIVVVPQFADIYRIATEVDIEVYAQHIDNITPGSCTGSVLVESLKASGASGSLLNHSERRIKLADIESCIGKLKLLGMTSIVCTNNINTTKAAAALRPDFVAIEPPELIGSGISVSRAKPEVISMSVEMVKKVSPGVGVLCGAGISNGEDVKNAINLGADGVLLASAVAKAGDPKRVLIDLIGGLE